jgi:hypothetical protein
MADETPQYKCEKCGAQFTEPEGGAVCVLCLQPYCKKHLAKKGTEAGPLCQTCGGAKA